MESRRCAEQCWKPSLASGPPEDDRLPRGVLRQRANSADSPDLTSRNRRLFARSEQTGQLPSGWRGQEASGMGFRVSTTQRIVRTAGFVRRERTSRPRVWRFPGLGHFSFSAGGHASLRPTGAGLETGRSRAGAGRLLACRPGPTRGSRRTLAPTTHVPTYVASDVPTMGPPAGAERHAAAPHPPG
jgi:hypothetical protein